jgi:hypothetical protein
MHFISPPRVQSTFCPISIRLRCFLTLRRKKSLAERKIRSVSLLVADLERKVREAVTRRRHDFKQVIPTPHCIEIWIHVFPEKELRGLRPIFHIHVCERSTYIFPRSVLNRSSKHPFPPPPQTTLQRNLDLCIPRKGIARPPSHFPHSCL